MPPAKKLAGVAILAIAAAIALIFLWSDRGSPFRFARTAQAIPAPDFTLPQLDGTELHLSDYQGKVVLLDFWATWCDPCREETPHFVEMQRKYGDRGLQVIGVSMDDTDDPVRTYYREFHMNYPVVMGNAKLGEQYGGVLGLPIVFIIGRNGRIFARHIGSTDAAVFQKEIETLLQSE